MTAADVEPVNRWIRECEVAWIECQSADRAEALENATSQRPRGSSSPKRPGDGLSFGYGTGL